MKSLVRIVYWHQKANRYSKTYRYWRLQILSIPVFGGKTMVETRIQDGAKRIYSLFPKETNPEKRADWLN